MPFPDMPSDILADISFDDLIPAPGLDGRCTCASCTTAREILATPPTPENSLVPDPVDFRWTAAPMTVSADALSPGSPSGLSLVAQLEAATRRMDRQVARDVWQFMDAPSTDPLPDLDPEGPPVEESRSYIPRAVRADWRTPEPCLVPVREALGGDVGLDPCASTEHWLAGGDEIAVLNFHEEDDGLALDWAKSLEDEGAPKTVFVNPPFNRNKDWVKKCAEEAAKGLEVILLIPARTDTRYWQNVIAETAQAICFWRGRITFVGADAGAPFPCAFVYWGPNAANFDNAFDSHGQVLYTNNEVRTAP